MQRLSGHIGACRTAKAAHHAGDFKRRASAAKRDVFRPVGQFMAGRARSVNLSGRDAVDAYTKLGEVLRQRFGQADDAMFGSRDVRSVLEAEQRGDAGEVDYAAIA